MTEGRHLSDEQISAHIDGVLGSAESVEVADHLFACGECSSRLEQLRATSRAVGGLPIEEPPRAPDLGFLREGLRADVRPAAASRPGWWSRLSGPPAWGAAGLAAAAVLVIAVVGAPGILSNLRSGGGASTAQGPAAQGGVAPALGGSASPSGTGADSTQHGAARPAPGGAAVEPAPNQGSAPVPGANGLSLFLAAPSATAHRGDTVTVVARLDGGSSDVTLGAYSLTVNVVPGASAPTSPGGAVGGTEIGSYKGDSLTIRRGGVEEFAHQWVSTLGTTAPGSYTLVATLNSSAYSARVTIPITLS